MIKPSVSADEAIFSEFKFNGAGVSRLEHLMMTFVGYDILPVEELHFINKKVRLKMRKTGKQAGLLLLQESPINACPFFLTLVILDQILLLLENFSSLIHCSLVGRETALLLLALILLLEDW